MWLRRICLVLMLTVFSWYSGAEDFPMTTISLKPILEQLQIRDEGHDVVPLHSDGDLIRALKDPKSAPTVRIPLGIYPISSFAASGDGHWAAMTFHHGLLDEDSSLFGSTVLMSLNGSEVKIHKVLQPAALLKGKEKPAADELEFIQNRFLRIEILGEDPENDGGLDYGRIYQFFDMSTGQTFSLENDFGLGKILHARAFSKYHYAVTYKVDGKKLFSIVRFDPAEKKMVVLTTTTEEDFAINVQHSPVDEEGRDVAHLSDDQVWISVRHEDEKNVIKIAGEKVWMEKGSVKLGPRMNLIRNGEGLIGAGNNNGHVEVLNSTGNKVLYSYKTGHPDLFGYLTRVRGGYIEEMGNHPNYGFYFMSDKGEVKALTPDRFRLIHSRIMPTEVVGVSNFNPHTNELYLYRIAVPGAEQEAPIANEKREQMTRSANQAGYPKAYPIVHRVREGRMVLVQISEKELGVVDMFQDEQMITRIDLLDPQFQIQDLPTTTIVEYPSKNVRHVYARPSFRKVLSYGEEDTATQCEGGLALPPPAPEKSE